ncbi:MAG TPA: maltose alpha-D-glucosyltransferase [Vicinamibacterales bacterium]|nr:maltose alpha-D-glucosyltransferase [Vicinamibacterales bacterium]
MTSLLSDDPLWYKDAVIYEAHVRTFFDSTNDGVGDFPGLTQKLDYLAGLGINALWLLPFYASPLRDDGYDIAHYEGIHPSYGTLRDFKVFMREAHERGIRVITELVVNHTSDQHPWFQAARRAPAGSPKRDFYVWSDSPQKYQGVRIIFTDSEKSNWTWDEQAQAYYWHRFFHHQPDLNFDNPHVTRAILRVMKFWLDMGVDGMRLDAVPYLIEREGTICENLDETHAILRQFRRELDAKYRNRMLLAEANQWPADVRAYFGDGDECHMSFHFPLMPRMYMALKQEDRHPITEILRQTPAIPDSCQWAIFLRNHDEMTLEMVTDEERDYMYSAYAADPQMRINVGIRRRLAPLVDNDRQRIELLNALLFSMPGTPVVYYGDEIGMGDNIYLGDRNGVRTPMQWTPDRNAGFSKADPARLYAPPIMDPVYGYQAINVEAQERSPSSLLNWMKRMIALRKQHHVFSRGSIEFLPAANRKVLSYIRRFDDDVVLCVANLSRTVQPVELNLAAYDGWTPVEMLGQTAFPRIGELPYFLTLHGYGFYWFKLERQPAPIAVRTVTQQSDEVPLPAPLFAGPAWETLLDSDVRRLIEQDLLLPFLERQRWFGGKGRAPVRARFVEWIRLADKPDPVFLTHVAVQYADGGDDTYVLPIVARPAGADFDPMRVTPYAVIGRLSGARSGYLLDASSDPGTARVLLDLVSSSGTRGSKRGSVQGEAAEALPGLMEGVDLTPRHLTSDQSNTALVFGETLFLKLYRRYEAGENPDLEIVRHLAAAGFRNIAPYAGSLLYRSPDQPQGAVAMLQGFVANEINGWEHAVDELQRFFDRVHTVVQAPDPHRAAGPTPPAAITDAIGTYFAAAKRLGTRTGEMHAALAAASGNPAFEPEPLTAERLERMAASMRALVEAALQAIGARRGSLPAHLAPLAGEFLGRRDRLLTEFDELAALAPQASVTRVHGDFHLGQLLWSRGDCIFLDFEGEPARPLAERREKQSPLKDVAGMMRSFSYASHAALYAWSQSRPHDFDRLEPWARVWAHWASTAFLDAWRQAVGAASFAPKDAATFDRLLRVFLLEKACYEIQYEINNRPEWVRIPLVGVLALAKDNGQP